MIPYADLERAIARWKSRKADGDSGAVAHEEVGAVSEMFVDPGMSYEGHFSHEAPTESSSGVIQIGDADLDDEKL
jgi:hypothetical protein